MNDDFKRMHRQLGRAVVTLLTQMIFLLRLSAFIGSSL